MPGSKHDSPAAPHRASRPAPVGRSRAAVTGRNYLARQLPGALSGEGVALLVVPAPPVDPSRAGALFHTAGGEPAVLWNPPENGFAFGHGAAVVLRSAGPGRFERLRDDAERLFRSIRPFRAPGCAPFAPTLYGGFAFAEGGTGAEAWRDFDEGAFTLPRWCYRRENGEATLSLAVDPAAPPDAGALLAEHDALLGRLEGAAAGITPPAGDAPPEHERDAGPGSDRIGEGGKSSLRQMEEGRWTGMVEAIRDIILSGEIRKIVAARLAEATLDAPIDVSRVLSRLGAANPRCYRFAFRAGDSVFLGATPERLARKRDLRIWTEALAGSIGSPRSAAPEERKRTAARLLASSKDRDEHAIVVDSVGRRLRTICSDVELPDRPSVVELPHVMHLHTPITGRLAKRTHILDLVAALHPTPSVGGVPTDRAIEWIVRNEPDPRGWYAGPVGWFDADGDGEFAVALRCGLVSGSRAWIYAGAGIVRDSDPVMEYAETNIKQTALLRALGIDP